jgi:nucleoside-diphosphate-sugar epimerase
VRVLVTGATGFIGGRLVRQLVEANYQVRALVRDRARARELAAAGVELAEGDVTDAPSIERALDGVEGILHLAAVYDFGVDPTRMRAVNVEGTRKLLDAAKQREIKRILYCGSDTSLGDTAGQLRDESWQNHATPRSTYEATKREAHQLVQERISGGAPIVNAIVSTVYGPGDTSVIGELIENHLAGRLAFTLDRRAGYTFAHVDDVATALRLAFEKGRLGESYLVSGQPAAFAELFHELSAVTHIPPPAVEVPGFLVGVLLPLMGLLLGKSRAAAQELVAMGRHVTRFFSGDKARRELGWSPRSLREGLSQTVPWLATRERAAAEVALGRTRIWLIALCLLDLGLGLQATLVPHLYVQQLHPRFAELHPAGPDYWLVRTGALWLFFAFVEGLAAWAPRQRPLAVFLVGALRLMDVPADLVYLFRADDLGTFGTVALIASPIFNFCVGVYLALTGARGLRARMLPYG